MYSLIKNASEPISITVAENKSNISLKPILQEYVDNKQISRALIFKENTMGWAYAQMLEDFPPKEDLFIMTDLDLIVPDGCDYIKLTRESHNRGNIITGATLDMVNMVPPNHGYGGDNDGFGVWIMGLSYEVWKSYPSGQIPLDWTIRTHFSSHGPGEKILDIRCYHQGWDLWKDDPEHFKSKQDNPGQWYKSKPDMSYNLL